MDLTASSENRFNLQFTTYKDLSDTVLSAQVPEITQSNVIIPYEGLQVKVSGDSEEIGELNLTMKLEENWDNYITIFEWMQWNKKYANDPANMIFDTIEYFILNAEYKPILSFQYGYVFPTVLTQIDHTTMTSTGDELEFTITFVVNSLKMNNVI